MAKKTPTKKKISKPKVKIYTTPTCTYCRQAKAYFKAKKIVYKEVDVTKSDKSLQEMIALTGHVAVPQIIVNGKVVIGFDKEEIEKALKS